MLITSPLVRATIVSPSTMILRSLFRRVPSSIVKVWGGVGCPLEREYPVIVIVLDVDVMTANSLSFEGCLNICSGEDLMVVDR